MTMIDASAEVAKWEKKIDAYGEWRVSPGVDWCPIGFLVKFGLKVGVSISASVGDRASVGAWARVGAGASVGEGVSVGEGASVGDKSTLIADLGSYEGYRKCLCALDGVAYIGAGCRWFTLKEAKKHWSAKKKDRRITRSMLTTASLIAKINKLKEG